MPNPLMPGDPMTEAHKQQLLKAILQKLSPEGEKPIVEYRVFLDSSVEEATRRLLEIEKSAETVLGALEEKIQEMHSALNGLDASSARILQIQAEHVLQTQRNLNDANTSLDAILGKSSTNAGDLAQLSSLLKGLQNSAGTTTETINTPKQLAAKPKANVGSHLNPATQGSGSSASTGDDRTLPDQRVNPDNNNPAPAQSQGLLGGAISMQQAVIGFLVLAAFIALAVVLFRQTSKPAAGATETGTQAVVEPEPIAEVYAESLEDCQRMPENPDCVRLADDFDRSFSVAEHCKTNDEESAAFCALAKSLPKANDKNGPRYRYSTLCVVVAQGDDDACKRGLYRLEKRIKEAAKATAGDGNPA